MNICETAYATVAATLLLACGSGLCVAQDTGTSASKPTQTALVVRADQEYGVKVDDKSRGRARPGAPLIVPVEPGPHTVVGESGDGRSTAPQTVEAVASKRTTVSLTIKAANAREASAGVHSNETQEPKQVTTEEKAAEENVAGAYSDGATGLMWTATDNGSKLNFEEAGQYCSSLRLGGHSDWRLPHVGELQGLYDVSGRKPPRCRDDISGGVQSYPVRIRKEIDLGCYSVWSDTRGHDVPMRNGPSSTMKAFNYYNGGAYDRYSTQREKNSVLCVRGGAR